MENRTPEELAELAKEIRRRVQASVSESLKKADEAAKQTNDTMRKTEDGGTRKIQKEFSSEDGRIQASIDLEVDSLSPTAREVGESDSRRAPRDESFWDLGQPKPRIYAKPDFGERVGVTEVTAPDPDPEPGEMAAQAEKIIRDPNAQSGEKIPPRTGYTGSTGRVVNTVSGQRSVDSGRIPGRVVINSYRKKNTGAMNRPREADQMINKAAGSTLVKTYTPEGALIREISVRTWESDTEFYNRFLTDALRSHNAPSPYPVDAKVERVPYFSYVPQYSHMSGKQVDFYRWVRECVRNGRTPGCDFPYVLLYIYEILNLPDVIAPEDGVRLLARIWLGYRAAYPRLDGYLCEWLPDYCMIHGLPLPEELNAILPEIVPKAQFKEFYFNQSRGGMLARTVIENSSDYDYRMSRYYGANKDAYEKHIPAAVSLALAEQAGKRTGIFALDRVYKMTRDSFCGAIVASSVKRRLDIEFTSFTRRADTRNTVTALVKYSENRLRMTLGIKAKLGVGGITEEDSRTIDAYFVPMMPTKEQIRQKKEDAYMPADYLKNYEAEDHGFDPMAAQAIEAQSWANTSRLTGEDYGGVESPDASEPWEEPIVLEGELTADETVAEEPIPEQNAPEIEEPPQPKTTEAGEASGRDPLLAEALRAALDGEFRAFCRERGLYEGDVADKLNTVFLDVIGDVVLEAGERGFELIEDYREDAEEWLK